MKKEKNLRVFLYVVLVLSLIYTCFTIFQAYATWSVYYQGMSYDPIELIAYLVSNCYVPLCFTVIFYVMVSALDIWCTAIERITPKSTLEMSDQFLKNEERKEEKEMNQVEKDVREVTREGVKAAKEERRAEVKEAREDARELRKEARELDRKSVV